MGFFRSKSLAVFYRELSTLLSGGMAIVQAVGEMVGHVRYGEFRNAVWRVQADLEQGKSLSEAFAVSPRVFPSWQIGVIKAGEESGNLADTLRMLADQMESSYGDTLKLLVGLAYPAFMLAAALVLTPFMNVGTCGVGGCVSASLKNVLIGAGVIAAILLLSRNGGRAAMQQIALGLPFVGKLMRQLAVTRFMRALRSLTAAGVPVLTGWKVAAGAAGNESVRATLMKALGKMEAGGTLADAFRAAHIFPDYMLGMVSSGERSGSIVRMLDSCAEFCEKENQAAIGVMLRIVPVAAYLAVAFFVGLALMSAYSGYYTQLLNGLQ